MGLVDDDGEVVVTHITDGITHKREFLDGSYDDALVLFDSLFQFYGTVGVGYNLVALSESPDIVRDLFVEQFAVCHHDDRIKQRFRKTLGPDSLHCNRTGLDEFECQPCQ